MSTTKIINFMGVQRIAVAFSVILILISVASLLSKGLNLGLDFTGGTLVEVVYPESVEPEQIRKQLTSAGYNDLTVQHFGTSKNIMIRLAPQEGVDKNKLGDTVLDILKADNSAVIKVQSGFVGPQIGEELREDGGLAMLYALIGILIYIALRFELRFSGGAIFALVHDVVITLGFFSVTQVEFDMTVLAAILAIIGYSLNDTIVVFDRIRENFRVFLKQPPEQVINISINHTLTRTLITSLTTLLVLVTLFFLGGKIIHSFALAMIVGVIVGTYSSIYIASSSLLMMGITKEALLPPEKENEELDDRP
jgi:preprotein translocase subunit SecF